MRWIFQCLPALLSDLHTMGKWSENETPSKKVSCLPLFSHADPPVNNLCFMADSNPLADDAFYLEKRSKLALKVEGSEGNFLLYF